MHYVSDHSYATGKRKSQHALGGEMEKEKVTGAAGVGVSILVIAINGNYSY